MHLQSINPAWPNFNALIRVYANDIPYYLCGDYSLTDRFRPLGTENSHSDIDTNRIDLNNWTFVKTVKIHSITLNPPSIYR